MSSEPVSDAAGWRRSPRHIFKLEPGGLARKRLKSRHSSRAEGGSTGPSGLDGKSRVVCGSARKPSPRPVAALRASPLATPAIRAC